MDNLKMISEPIDINNDFNKMLKIFKDLIDSAYVPDGSSKKEVKALKEVKDITNEFVERVNLLTVIEQLKLLGINTNTCSKLRQSLKGSISKYSKMSKLMMENAIKTTSFISNRNTITEEYAEPFIINSETDNILISDKIYYYYFTNKEDFKTKDKTGFSLQKQLFETNIVERLISGFTEFTSSKSDFYEQVERKEQDRLANSNLENIEVMYDLNKFSLDPDTLKRVEKDMVSLKFKYMELSKLEYAKELLVMLPIMTHISSSDKKLYNKIIIEVDQKMASALNSIAKMEESLNSILDLKDIVVSQEKREDEDFTNVDIEKYYNQPAFENIKIEKNDYKNYNHKDLDKNEFKQGKYQETILLHPDYIGVKRVLFNEYNNSSLNMSFLTFLRINYPQYVILIEYEETIEKRNSLVCEDYIKYYNGLEDKSDAMSINDYAKFIYDIVDFEVPFHYQERINNLTVKNK